MINMVDSYLFGEKKKLLKNDKLLIRTRRKVMSGGWVTCYHMVTAHSQFILQSCFLKLLPRPQHVRPPAPFNKERSRRWRGISFSLSGSLNSITHTAWFTSKLFDWQYLISDLFNFVSTAQEHSHLPIIHFKKGNRDHFKVAHSVKLCYDSNIFRWISGSGILNDFNPIAVSCTVISSVT